MTTPTAPRAELSSFFRARCEFEPRRQITGIVCSILYYDVQGYAGLTRGRVMLGVRLVVARLFGVG
ncbi:hypothetical protein [Streptomyces capitiformicae]|uniref:hypothetical protein n=1 Tax=Streptomyces capitiformicae TaxID=2014920 RepID=UPI0016776964|nr:hypothetical protein [Streptomyces capitiformicae]